MMVYSVISGDMAVVFFCLLSRPVLYHMPVMHVKFINTFKTFEACIDYDTPFSSMNALNPFTVMSFACSYISSMHSRISG